MNARWNGKDVKLACLGTGTLRAAARRRPHLILCIRTGANGQKLTRDARRAQLGRQVQRRGAQVVLRLHADPGAPPQQLQHRLKIPRLVCRTGQGLK